MNRSSVRIIRLIFAALPAIGFAQVIVPHPPPPPPPRVPGLRIQDLAEPPVPVDPLEIVTTAETAPDAQTRLEAINLLDKARNLSNLKARPYDLKTTFQATGGSASDGVWMLEDIGRAPGLYRWTAQGPGYSSINLYPKTTRGMLYSNQSNMTLPMRLAQVRDALFFVYQIPGPQASVRTATASLNGVPQSCVLVVIGAGNRRFTGGRNWEETEYCVDAATGLLSTWSPAPGLYVQYDYAGAPAFHGRTIPSGFTITEGGRKVIDAKIVSMGEPPEASDPMFTTAGLSPIGVGREMAGPSRSRSFGAVPGQRFPASSTNASMQVVLVHATTLANGQLAESEILASSDPSLNQAALQRAQMFHPGAGTAQPGVTEAAREEFFTIEFVTSSR